jgi:uncharacterized membrane protein YphA (DoxX/SURF4 family)
MRRVAATWERFWFAPEPTSSLALFRIAIGVISFGWGVSLLPDMRAFFSATGIEPAPPVNPPAGTWGVLNTFPDYPVAVALVVALLLASLCLTVGYRTRLASVVVFIAVVSFEHRTPSIWNSGDGVLRILCFYLMFAPAGASLSLDRWRTARDRFWEFPARPHWALRLVQIQVSAMYLSAVWFKLHGTGWLDGTAVSYATRVEDLERFAPPGFLSDSLLFSSVATYWTLVIELMIGLLVWNRAARPYVLGLGVALHVSAGLTLRLGFFSETMLAAYLVFLSPTAASVFILAGRDRCRAALLRVRATPVPVAPAISPQGESDLSRST